MEKDLAADYYYDQPVFRREGTALPGHFPSQHPSVQDHDPS